MGDFVDQVVVGVLQQYGVALLRAVSPATLTPAVADVRHLASLRWRAPHARVVHDAIETLFEILEDVGAPVPAVAELEVLADDEPQPMQWPLRAAFEAVLRDDVAALLYLLDRTALTAESTADAADARALPWLSAGDTLAQVARRFEVAWCTRLLEARQPPPKNPLHRRLKHSPAPHRRGSYSVMKLDFAKRQNDPTIQVLVHFPDEARVVGYTVVPDKKARHVVYDLAEAYQMDFEAFSLQNAAGHWLDDYKALRAGGVRSGDELWVVLKHKALHQQKHFCVRVVVVLRNGEQRTLAVSIDPYTLIRTLRAHVVERVREADAAMDFMLPIAVGKGALGGVWLDGDKTFSSYGLAECGLLQRVGDEGAAQRPLLMGTRESVRLYPMAGLREPDPRIERWLEIVAHFGDYTSGLKRTELRAALLLGVPACLRGRVWELLLFGHAFQSSGDQFEDLVDRDVANEAEDRILEQIGNDIDRTMPYHPSFRDKCGFGQVNLARVLRAYATRDPELGYCQGMNFIVATLLGFLSPEASYHALALLMDRYRLRSNFTTGMTGLHSMLTAFDDHLHAELPDLHRWMVQENVIVASFASEWFLTLFSSTAASSSSDDAAARIWDVFLESGTPFLFKVALTILAMKQGEMVAAPEEAVDIIKTALQSIDITQVVTRAAEMKLNKK